METTAVLQPRMKITKPPKEPRFSVWRVWQTLFEIDSKYVPIKPVGKGAYGVVCSAINNETNEKVAIKKIADAFGNSSDALRTLRELSLSRQIQHENVVALKDVVVPGERKSFKDVYLVYELMDTDLDRILKSPQQLSAEHCQYLMFQLLQGLRHLHAVNVLHRDLKPSNILLNSNSDLKICDFGLARSNNEEGGFMTEYVVTRWYRAPEILIGCYNYGKPIDMWSVGCIFAEILGRQLLFPGSDNLNQLELIIGMLGSPKEADMEFVTNPKSRRYIDSMPFFQGKSFEQLFPDADALALDLMGKLLVFDPSKRITADEALQHPYLLHLWDPSRDLPTPTPTPVRVVGDKGWSEEVARALMWLEMLNYHPERRWFGCSGVSR